MREKAEAKKKAQESGAAAQSKPAEKKQLSFAE